MIAGIAHVGICVKDSENAVRFFQENFDAVVQERVEYPQMGQVSTYVKLKDGQCFEIMSPIGETGVVADFLEKKGEGFHHLSLKSDSWESVIAEYEEKGYRIVSKGDGYAFLHPKSAMGILYEICRETN